MCVPGSTERYGLAPGASPCTSTKKKPRQLATAAAVNATMILITAIVLLWSGCAGAPTTGLAQATSRASSDESWMQ